MKVMCAMLGLAAALASCKANLTHSTYDGGDTDVGVGGTPGAAGKSGGGGAVGTGGMIAATGGAPGLADGSVTASGGNPIDSAGAIGSGGRGSGGATGTGGGAHTDASMDAPADAGGLGSGGTTAGDAGSAGQGGSSAETDAGAPCVPACPGGATCRAGTCVCFEDMALCGGYCVDTRSARTHCGNCTTTCEDGCSAGHCYKTVVKGAALPLVGVAINATDIYFGDRDKGTLSRVPRKGGTPVVLANGESTVGMLALDGDALYWTRAVGAAGGGICRMPLSGGACTALVTLGQPSVIDMIALDATNVYWSSETPYLVNKVPKTGGGVTEVASGTYTGGKHNLLTDDKNLYWAGGIAGGSVFEIPLSGGTAVPLTSGISLVDNGPYVAVTRGSVYALDTPATGSQHLLAIRADDGSVTPVMDTNATWIIADEGAIYLLQRPRNVITRFDLNTGTTTELAEEEPGVFFMAVEGSDLFWTGIAGDIKSTPKKP